MKRYRIKTEILNNFNCGDIIYEYQGYYLREGSEEGHNVPSIPKSIFKALKNERMIEKIPEEIKLVRIKISDQSILYNGKMARK